MVKAKVKFKRRTILRPLPFERKAKKTTSFFRIPKKLQYFINKYKKRLGIKNDQDFIYYILVEYIRQQERTLTSAELIDLKKSVIRAQNWKKITQGEIKKKLKLIEKPKDPIF